MDATRFTLPQVRTGAGSEGGHWYIPSDPPQCAYEILGANGKWRSANMRDARKHGWFPGVTTITRLEASPGLERWKVRQGIMAALTHPKAHEIADINELMRVLEEDSKAEARQAAERGTAIHKAIEDYYATGRVDNDYEPYITGVRKQIEILVGTDKREAWRTEETRVHTLGFGTRVDLYSQEFDCVIDFKGKEFNADDKITAYPEQCRQLAACRAMVSPSARCVNLFVSRNNPGLAKAFEWTNDDLQKGWQEFITLLAFWQVKNGFPIKCTVAA
jgi:hypothetical protein